MIANVEYAIRRSTLEARHLAGNQNLLLQNLPGQIPEAAAHNTSIGEQFAADVLETKVRLLRLGLMLKTLTLKTLNQGQTLVERLMASPVKISPIQRLAEQDASKALAALQASRLPLSALDDPTEKILAHRLLGMYPDLTQALGSEKQADAFIKRLLAEEIEPDLTKGVGQDFWLEHPCTNMERAAKTLAGETLEKLKQQAAAENALRPKLNQGAKQAPSIWDALIGKEKAFYIQF
jgi:hypothetical protein